VSSCTSCGENTTCISWSQTGPVGLPGPVSPAGSVGPAGPAGSAGPPGLLPGDGQGNGQALNYPDNGDGTFTDINTNLMWEKKTNVAGSVHNVGNTYTWSSNRSAADGTLFTAFLNTLNNECSDETTTCSSDTDCTNIGIGKCGFAGHRDWRISNVIELLSIINYSLSVPASSFPGLSCPSISTPCYIFSATTFVVNPAIEWVVGFPYGGVNANENDYKTQSHGARAVRP